MTINSAFAATPINHLQSRAAAPFAEAGARAEEHHAEGQGGFSLENPQSVRTVPPIASPKIASSQIAHTVRQAVSRIDNAGSLFSEDETQLLNARMVSGEDRQRFTAIFNKAVASGGFNNPVQYINNLSKEDIGVLQRVHSFADASGVKPKDVEGAVNLLLPPKTAVDLNNDSLVNRGATTGFHFPPPNAPQAVKDAWGEATAGLGPDGRLEAQLPFLTAIMTANIRVDEAGQFIGVNEPNSDVFVNPFPSDAIGWHRFLEGKISEYQKASELDATLNRHTKRLETFYSALDGVLNNTVNNADDAV